MPIIVFFDLHFPSLEHIQLSVIQIAWGRDEQIEAVIKRNPQILSIRIILISINIFPLNYVEFIKRFMPNIENLTVSHIEIAGDPIHFEYVKNFRLMRNAAITVDKLFFSRLESLHIDYSIEY